LNTIISSTSDAIVVNSREGHPVLLNPAAERLLSLQSSEVRDCTWDELLDDQALLSLFESALDSQRPYSIEVTTTEERVLYASITPLKDLGVVLVMHDVTESKELERVRWAAERAEKERLRQTLERYVGSELAERVLHQKRGLLEQRERVDAVVLFADLRGFTRVTGHLSPDTVVNILNAFFTEMGQLVHSNQGTIFDLIGDELMVGYGVPFPQDDAADRALQVAVAMQRRFAQLSEHWLDKHDVELGLGIGLNRGPVIVGNIGSPSLMHYTMVGDPVNFAHRLVEIAGPSEIILSESVLGGLLNPVKGLPVERLLPQTIKGKEGTHVLHRVKI
jgi:PAS domain S-box-containing protein